MQLKSKMPNVTDFYEESPNGIAKEMQNGAEETVIKKNGRITGKHSNKELCFRT